MASVKELFDSRTGSSIGSAGVNLSRLFLVLTDNPTDDPAKELQRNRLGVPYQAANPWNLDAKAIGYAIQKRIGPMAWFVVVTYELPNVITEERGGIFPGWEVQIRGGGEQERLLQELPPNLAEPIDPPRIYGPPRYEEVGEEDTQTHYVLKFVGDQSVVLPLWQTDQRIPVGWTRSLPSMELTITKEVHSLTLGGILSAHSFLKTVNDASFFGGGVGHVLLNAIQLSSRPGEPEAVKAPTGGGLRRIPSVPIGVQSALVWKVSLVFGYSVNRWDESTQPHIWEDAKGAQSLVYADSTGAPVEEKFRTGLESNFEELLRIFA